LGNAKWLIFQQIRLADGVSSTVKYAVSPVSIAIEGTGGTILMTDGVLFAALYRLDLSSNALTQVTGAGIFPPDMAMLSNGQEVLITNSSFANIPGDLFRFNVVTGQGMIVKSQDRSLRGRTGKQMAQRPWLRSGIHCLELPWLLAL